MHWSSFLLYQMVSGLYWVLSRRALNGRSAYGRHPATTCVFFQGKDKGMGNTLRSSSPGVGHMYEVGEHLEHDTTGVACGESDSSDEMSKVT